MMTSLTRLPWVSRVFHERRRLHQVKEDKLTPEQMTRLRNFQEHLVVYNAVKDVLADLKYLHEAGVQHGGAGCMLVLGPSGSGKTITLHRYKGDHPPVIEAERDRIPILLVEAPPRATPKGLAEVMLAALGDPAPSKGTLQSMSRRVENLLEARGVELVMLDEFQHLVDRQSATGRVAYDAADWIKGLLNKRICPIVLSGTELASQVIEANEQLHRRCASIIHLKPLPFGTQDERRYFRGILQEFDSGLPFDKPSGLADMDFAARIHVATGGLVGRVSHLLTMACRKAISEDLLCLDMQVLGDAWAALATSSTSGPNPFRTTTPPTSGPKPDTSRKTRLRSRCRKRDINEMLRA